MKKKAEFEMTLVSYQALQQEAQTLRRRVFELETEVNILRTTLANSTRK
jgi:hypothetical protein